MPPDAEHLRHHLNDLRSTLRWLRSLRPDGPRYKLWLGDLVEFTRAAFGPDSPQVGKVRSILTDRARLPDTAPEEARARHYLDRLDAFAALLAEFDRTLPRTITFIDVDNGSHG